MDKFDQHLIAILKNDARTPISELSRQINLSRTAVTARLKRLEQSGVIMGYQVLLKPEKPKDVAVSVYFALKYDTSNSERKCDFYAERVKQIPEIIWSHSISGETDMMLFAEAPSMTRVDEIREELSRIPEIRQVVTHTVLRELFNNRKDNQ